MGNGKEKKNKGAASSAKVSTKVIPAIIDKAPEPNPKIEEDSSKTEQNEEASKLREKLDENTKHSENEIDEITESVASKGPLYTLSTPISARLPFDGVTERVDQDLKVHPFKVEVTHSAAYVVGDTSGYISLGYLSDHIITLTEITDNHLNLDEVDFCHSFAITGYPSVGEDFRLAIAEPGLSLVSHPLFKTVSALIDELSPARVRGLPGGMINNPSNVRGDEYKKRNSFVSLTCLSTLSAFQESWKLYQDTRTIRSVKKLIYSKYYGVSSPLLTPPTDVIPTGRFIRFIEYNYARTTHHINQDFQIPKFVSFYRLSHKREIRDMSWENAYYVYTTSTLPPPKKLVNKSVNENLQLLEELDSSRAALAASLLTRMFVGGYGRSFQVTNLIPNGGIENFIYCSINLVMCPAFFWSDNGESLVFEIARLSGCPDPQSIYSAALTNPDSWPPNVYTRGTLRILDYVRRLLDVSNLLYKQVTGVSVNSFERLIESPLMWTLADLTINNSFNPMEVSLAGNTHVMINAATEEIHKVLFGDVNSMVAIYQTLGSKFVFPYKENQNFRASIAMIHLINLRLFQYNLTLPPTDQSKLYGDVVSMDKTALYHLVFCGIGEAEQKGVTGQIIRKLPIFKELPNTLEELTKWHPSIRSADRAFGLCQYVLDKVVKSGRLDRPERYLFICKFLAKRLFDGYKEEDFEEIMLDVQKRYNVGWHDVEIGSERVNLPAPMIEFTHRHTWNPHSILYAVTNTITVGLYADWISCDGYYIPKFKQTETALVGPKNLSTWNLYNVMEILSKSESLRKNNSLTYGLITEPVSFEVQTFWSPKRVTNTTTSVATTPPIILEHEFKSNGEGRLKPISKDALYMIDDYRSPNYAAAVVPPGSPLARVSLFRDKFTYSINFIDTIYHARKNTPLVFSLLHFTFNPIVYREAPEPSGDSYQNG